MCTCLKIANELPFPVFLWSSDWWDLFSERVAEEWGWTRHPSAPKSKGAQPEWRLGGRWPFTSPCRRGHPHSRDKDHILPAGNARAGRTVLSTPFPSCFLPLGQRPALVSWGPRSEYLGLRFLASSLQVSTGRNFLHVNSR